MEQTSLLKLRKINMRSNLTYCRTVAHNGLGMTLGSRVMLINLLCHILTLESTWFCPSTFALSHQRWVLINIMNPSRMDSLCTSPLGKTSILGHFAISKDLSAINSSSLQTMFDTLLLEWQWGFLSAKDIAYPATTWSFDISFRRNKIVGGVRPPETHVSRYKTFHHF